MNPVSLLTLTAFAAFAMLSTPGRSAAETVFSDDFNYTEANAFLAEGGWTSWTGGGGSKDTNDLDKLPQASTDSGNFVFSFVRNNDAWAAGDTTVAIEVGTDLATWPDSYPVPQAPGTHGPVTITENNGITTVTLTLPIDPDSTKFARLNVTVNP